MDLGLAEKLAVRAVATATGTAPEQVAARLREAGDLGQAAERLLAATAAADRPACRSARSSTRCTRSPRPRGRARRAANWSCWPGCSPGPPRWRPATCCAWSPGGCGWGSARRPSSMRSPRRTPAGEPPGRCWNGRTTSAATSAWSPRRSSSGGLAAVERLQVPAGQPGPGHARPAAVRGRRRSGQAGRAVRGRVQIRRDAGAGAPDRGRRGSSCSPGGWSASAPSSPTWSSCWRRDWARRGDRRGGGRRLRPGRRGAAPVPEVMFRRRKYGIAEACARCRSACSASRCCTPTARTSPSCPTRSGGPGWPKRSRSRPGSG